MGPLFVSSVQRQDCGFKGPWFGLHTCDIFEARLLKHGHGVSWF